MFLYGCLMLDKITTILLSLLCLTFCACHSSKRMNTKYNYFQKGLDSNRIINYKPLIIQPSDNLSISVSSNTSNQEQAAIFNAFNNGGNTSTSTTNQVASPTSGYLVDQGWKYKISNARNGESCRAYQNRAFGLFARAIIRQGIGEGTNCTGKIYANKNKYTW